MTDLHSGERQVSDTLEGIRADHRARYEWAAGRLAGKKVVDAACGVGYGAKILPNSGTQAATIAAIATIAPATPTAAAPNAPRGFRPA